MTWVMWEKGGLRKEIKDVERMLKAMIKALEIKNSLSKIP